MTTSSWIGNLWHSRNDVPSIEGMQHGGMAERLRKKYTVFGSKSDRLRVLAKALGVSFEEMTSSSEFRQALFKGQFLREIDRGSFGVVSHYRSSFKGHEFEYVMKTFHEEAELNAQKFLARGQTEVEQNLFLGKEASFLHELGETPSVPSLYGLIGGDVRAEGQLFMEYMPGQSLKKVWEADPTRRFSERGLQDIRETIEMAAEKGIRNIDIHSGNIIVGPSGEAFWPDWGYAKWANEKKENLAMDMLEAAGDQFGLDEPKLIEMADNLRRGLEAKEVSVAGRSIARGDLDTGPSTAASKKRQPSIDPFAKTPEASRTPTPSELAAEDLNTAQREIWRNMYFGGRGHERGSSSVKQLSRFGGSQSVTKR